jgi:hypothetical protein
LGRACDGVIGRVGGSIEGWVDSVEECLSFWLLLLCQWFSNLGCKLKLSWSGLVWSELGVYRWNSMTAGDSSIATPY